MNPFGQPANTGAPPPAAPDRGPFYPHPSLFPPDTVLGDPTRRNNLEHSIEKVIRLTVELGFVTQFIPGKAGQLFAKLIAGVEKDPGTGKVGGSASSSANFLPSPFGFLDPTAIGLKPNFYLPPGSSRVIPRPVDQIGFGLPQQREEDERRAAKDLDSGRLGFVMGLRNESDETIARLANGQGGVSRSGEIFSRSGLSFADVTALGQFEQARRAAAIDVTGALAGLRESNLQQLQTILTTIELLDQEDARISAAFIAAGFLKLNQAASASIKPEDIEPVADAAKRNAASARGIRRQLVSERADP